MCGNTCIGERCSFTLPQRPSLGSGGNGKVYEVTLDDDASGDTYAVKLFSCYGNVGVEEKKLRYKRFYQEIDFLEKVGNNIPGIIPIIDKHSPIELSENEKAWYMMPKARRFDFARDKSLYNQLHDLLLLANTLKTLHKMGYAHRDIKPSNILWYSNRICLCDFGLLWGYFSN